MVDVDRRMFSTGVGVALASVAIPRARADAPLRLKMANDLPISHPNTVRMQEAAERIRTETNGQIDIALFPNSQLGGDADMLSQVRSGALELFLSPGSLVSTLAPTVSVYGVAYAFTGYDDVWRAMDGDLGAYVRAATQKVGLHVMERMWDSGFRHVAANPHPVRTVDDLAGLKIRVPPSPLWTSTFNALGASPVSIPFAEVYSAMQTHLVDAQDVSLSGLETAKFYEVVKYCSLTRHLWEGFLLLANRAAWQAIPAAQQTIIARNLDAAALAARADIMKQEETLQATLAAQGMAFNAPESGSFRAKLKQAGYYATWKAKYGPEAWAALEKYSGPLG